MIIVITRPDFFDGEASRIVDMLNSGRADLIHIRKPQSSQNEVEHLLTDIPSELYSRLVLHDHFSLAVKYGLHGVHLNSRNPQPPSEWSGAVSISCHSFRELAECRRQSYAYSAFTRDVIAAAHAQHLIDDRVMALGGVTFNRVPDVLQMGFGGAMILGDAWR